MSYVHAERAPEALMDPADPWGTLGVHVVAAKGARGARAGGGVTVRSLPCHYYEKRFFFASSLSSGALPTTTARSLAYCSNASGSRRWAPRAPHAAACAGLCGGTQ